MSDITEQFIRQRRQTDRNYLVSLKFHELMGRPGIQARLALNEITVEEIAEIFYSGANAEETEAMLEYAPLESAETAVSTYNVGTENLEL